MLLSDYGVSNDRSVVPGGVEKLLLFAEEYRGDQELRSLADHDPHTALARFNIQFPAELDIRIVENTDKVFNLVMPPDPNAALLDEALVEIAGGKSASSAGTVGSASSIGTTFASASSAGSAGSAD